MRPMLEFISQLAVGFFVAAVLAITASDMLPIGPAGAGIARLDYGSLGLGLILGVLIANASRVGWVEIPRMVVSYVVSKRGTLRLAGWAVVFVGVLLLY